MGAQVPRFNKSPTYMIYGKTHETHELKLMTFEDGHQIHIYAFFLFILLDVVIFFLW